MRMPKLKQGLRDLRSSQPFNWVATSVVKSLWRSKKHPEFFIKHLPRSGTVRANLPNGQRLSLWSLGDDWIANQVYWRGWTGFEFDVAPLFFKLAAKARVTMDIGAHVGFYSVLAAHANPSGQIFAFEPLPVVFERFQRNIALNGIRNVQPFNVAVGENNQISEFYFDTRLGIPSGSSLSWDAFRSPDGQVMTVSVITLDRFVREHNLKNVDLVKIDTETTELQILRGMVETLKEFKPTIFCEIWGIPGPEFNQILYPLGYRCYDLTVTGPIPHKENQVALNYLFTTLNDAELARL